MSETMLRERWRKGRCVSWPSGTRSASKGCCETVNMITKNGATVTAVPPKNTSRRCSQCGTVDPANRPGCGRQFACVSCGYRDHADKNAALNIETLAFGSFDQAGGPTDNSAGRRKPSQSQKATGESVKRVDVSIESKVAWTTSPKLRRLRQSNVTC